MSGTGNHEKRSCLVVGANGREWARTKNRARSAGATTLDAFPSSSLLNGINDGSSSWSVALAECIHICKSNAPELCPPHWRLEHHRRRKSFLTSRTAAKRITTPRKPQAWKRTMGRMKDSDDYITARAANPWTGLISPSPGTQTPRTPESPGDALNLRRKAMQQISPTHAVKRRPILTKANEGRKVSSGSETAGANTNTQDRLAPGNTPGERQDDKLIHMPSAREPQPFAYPGYTAEQIEALEHYREKARRVSSEGYDRRRFPSASANAPSADDREGAFANCSRPHDRSRLHHNRSFAPYNACDEEPATASPPTLTVRKRDNLNAKISRILQRTQSGQDTAASTAVANQVHGAASVTPRSSQPSATMYPHDSIIVQDDDNNLHGRGPAGPRRSKEPYAERESAAADRGDGALRPEVCVDDKCSAPRNAPVNDRDDTYVGYRSALDDIAHDSTSSRCAVAGSESMPDLRHLPRVRLLKPEHAAVPRAAAAACRRTEVGQCSLGCDRDVQSGACVQRRAGSTGSVVRHTSLFEKSSIAQPEREKVDYLEQSLDHLLLLLRYLGSLQIPRVGLLELLQDPEVSTKDKVEALKAVLSLAGHALAVCTLLAMLWKLGTSLVQFVEVVLWPLVLPLRMVKWILIR
ncbi:hypothetical protein CERZMDRAFT_115977 [Cercospora zeae-maydis SCOH1-5]|uniref:Uncharacterized protein n=1 Tax=Cercospora zeae-maydis SCOH1-5 TaxID=717836 RepID=A0A6A6FVZ7_9PEZI|nr:hypothetical protein CERZMDRAFT_115977 [Cercospora zeae-maydis SCOH1-5]